MQVNKIQDNNPVYKAHWIKNINYTNACKEAISYRAEHEMSKGEQLLSTFPNHELALMPCGIKNITTNKYHEFPVVVEDESPFENLSYFYDMLQDKKNKFIEKLFS